MTFFQGTTLHISHISVYDEDEYCGEPASDKPTKPALAEIDLPKNFCSISLEDAQATKGSYLSFIFEGTEALESPVTVSPTSITCEVGLYIAGSFPIDP